MSLPQIYLMIIRHNDDRLGMGRAPTPFHVGSVVEDLDEAIGHWGDLGVGPWVRSAWKTGRYYDGIRDRVVEARNRVAFGRLGPQMSLELIEADRAHDAPLAWGRGAGGIGHVGFWADDPRPRALELIRQGGRLVLARAVERLEDGARAASGDPHWLPDPLDTCYVQTMGGTVVEFVPASIWLDRLPALLGEALAEVIAAPPAAGHGTK